MADTVIEGFRPSPQQKRVWFQQASDGSLAYRAQCALTLKGNLQAELLKQALTSVVNRIEILRTTFHVPAGLKIPFQRIADRQTPDWRSLDLTDVRLADQELKIAELFKRDGLVPFDFQHGPLLRLSLVKLSSNHHILLLSLPTISADARSLDNLADEICRAYAAGVHGEEASAEVESYVQFSEWQNELLNDPDDHAGRDYWQGLDISNIGEPIFPCERKPVGTRSFEPAMFVFGLSSDIESKIAAAVERYDSSPAAFLLSCWQVFIWRLTRQPDIVTGVAFDGRPFQELQKMIGLLAQTLPIRCRIEDASKFSEILLQTNAAMRAAAEQQEYFTTETGTGSAADPAGVLCFPIAFEYGREVSSRVAAGVSFSVDRQYICIDRFKMKLCCVHTDHRITAELCYDPEFFDSNDVARLAGEYRALVESAAKNPEDLAGALAILADDEKRQLLVDFNDSRTGEIANTCVQQLFEQQADRAPNACAVVCEDKRLTYAELNARANQLAHYLRRQGVGSEVPVALQLERSVEMIVALLAILKAGGAYVPLDPALPKERMAGIMDDARASVVVTEQNLAKNLPERRMQVVSMDMDSEAICRESKNNPVPVATAENLAYVIFTSGSTGRPKGVAIEHKQLSHYLKGIIARLDLPDGGASFATVSSLTADLGNTAIFPALCSGGSLHVITHERASDADAFGQYCRLRAIDCLKIVPSHFETLLSGTNPKSIIPRKRLIFGGEACSWGLIDKVRALSPDCVILNHYGPTETTIGATTYRVASNDADRRPTTPPIGRPLANTQTYVLDSHLQPVPIWVVGELYIGGGGLARGYYNRSELTAEKFVRNPFSDDPEARLYRTGDLVRYLPGGDLEFVGRIDNQIKIRGFRVELSEIETILAGHPAVEKSVVVASHDIPGDTRLIAYFVPAQVPNPTANEFRSFLEAKLPAHMIPSRFVAIKAFPLTLNGKLDRRALEAVRNSELTPTDAFVAPRTPHEKTIAEIWAEILKLEQVSVEANFFDLGGHSLLATQVISRLRNAFQVAVPLGSLFEAPTVAGLARYLESHYSLPHTTTTTPPDAGKDDFEKIEL